LSFVVVWVFMNRWLDEQDARVVHEEEADQRRQRQRHRQVLPAAGMLEPPQRRTVATMAMTAITSRIKMMPSAAPVTMPNVALVATPRSGSTNGSTM
jgi:hypothetical protein